MAVRKRKHDESFEDYRKNLKSEDFRLANRISGRMSHLSIQYLKDKVKGAFARTSTFKAGRNAEKRKRKETMQFAKRG